MDFRQFRYFVAVAEDLHFARAAERLNTSQPALSQQIKRLEQQLGARLFHRAKRRIELTEAGAAFLREARATLERAEKAVRVTQDTARGELGRLDIGIVGSVVYESYFPRLLQAYRASHPGVQLALHERTNLAQIEALRNQRLDIAVLREPIPPPFRSPEIEFFVWSRHPVIAALPAGHPLARGQSVALSDLAASPFLAFSDHDGAGMNHALFDLCRSAGFEPEITQRVSEIATLISLVAAGFGVGLVPEAVQHLQLPGVRYLCLSDREAKSNLLVAYRRFERSATINGLIEKIRAASPVKRPG